MDGCIGGDPTSTPPPAGGVLPSSSANPRMRVETTEASLRSEASAENESQLLLWDAAAAPCGSKSERYRKLATELSHASSPLSLRERKPGRITGMIRPEVEQAVATVLAVKNPPAEKLTDPISAPLRATGLALLTDQRRRIPSVHMCQEHYWDLTESLPDDLFFPEVIAL